MTLEHVYVIPHGDEIIDRPNQESRELYNLISRIGADDKSETLVILSPHGLRLGSSIGVLNTEYLKADLTLKTCRIRRLYRNDRVLAASIIESDNIAQEVAFITSSGPKSVFPLDFGSIIPLYFFNKKELVAIGQPRIWNSTALVDFGTGLARAAQNSERRVSIIVSADQAHTHSPVGPYGFAEESAKYEEMIEKCIRKSDLSELGQ